MSTLAVDLKSSAGEVLRRAVAGRRVLDLALLRVDVRDELREVLRRHRRVDGQDQRHAQQVRDRRQVLRRIERHLLVEARIDHDRRARRDEQRVAVGRRLGDHRRADVAAGAAAVVDDERLLQLLRQPLGHRARGDVRRSARRPRHDDGDRLGRIRLRERDGRRPRRGRDAEQDGEDADDALHGRDPSGEGRDRDADDNATGRACAVAADAAHRPRPIAIRYRDDLHDGRSPSLLRRRADAARVGAHGAHHHGVRIRGGALRAVPAPARHAAGSGDPRGGPPQPPLERRRHRARADRRRAAWSWARSSTEATSRRCRPRTSRARTRRSTRSRCAWSSRVLGVALAVYLAV